MTVPNSPPKDTPTRGEMDERVASGGPLGPCEWCEAGFHHMCTGVGCYGCPKENHRSVGASMLGKVEAPKEDEGDVST